MSDVISPGIHPFTLNGITWNCWVVAGGAYEWRSECGRFAAFRKDGLKWWARRDGVDGRIEYPTLIAAMAGASATRRQVA